MKVKEWNSMENSVKVSMTGIKVTTAGMNEGNEAREVNLSYEKVFRGSLHRACLGAIGQMTCLCLLATTWLPCSHAE